MNSLFIINNKSNNSNVLNAMVDEVQKYYHEVIIITPKMKKSNMLKFYKNDKLKIIEVNLIDIVKVTLTLPIYLFRDDVVKDIVLAKKRGKLDFKYIKLLIRYIIKAQSLKKKAMKLIYKPERVTLFSTWYYDNAYACALIKEKYPEIAYATYAHSYEVDYRKNNYIELFMKKYILTHIDKIFFISEKVMKEYIENLNEVSSFFEKYTYKYEVMHFGCKNSTNIVNKIQNRDLFRIVTCSGVSKVKRVTLLAEALINYQGSKIEWIHFGDGEMMGELNFLAESLNKKENMKVSLMGFCENKKIHEYYQSQQIDLFINISTSEGLPVSIMEAMSYGIPVLATDVGGNSEIVNEDNGFLIPSDITAEQLKMIIHEIRNNNMNLNEMRINAYLKWKNEFRLEDNIEALVSKLKILGD